MTLHAVLHQNLANSQRTEHGDIVLASQIRRQIGDTLNAEGIPARRGRWHAQTVARALERGPAQD